MGAIYNHHFMSMHIFSIAHSYSPLRNIIWLKRTVLTGNVMVDNLEAISVSVLWMSGRTLYVRDTLHPAEFRHHSPVLPPQQVFTATILFQIIKLNPYPKLERRNTVLLLLLLYYSCYCYCVTLRVPPLKSETGWTGELWFNCVLLILEK